MDLFGKTMQEKLSNCCKAGGFVISSILESYGHLPEKNMLRRLIRYGKDCSLYFVC